jgi:hypothetical protein
MVVMTDEQLVRLRAHSNDIHRYRRLAQVPEQFAKACSSTANIRHLRSLASPGSAVLVTHECVVSVNLAGKSRPALGEISQNLGLSFILYRSYQAKTFRRLISAMLGAVHDLNDSHGITKQALTDSAAPSRVCSLGMTIFPQSGA